ncbi:MAG: type II toxin-antitoxin system prevent-host-death family antitoxin [Caldilineaceae bacterium]|nr:type II toxin-antitoxin system prevent-host-death family antitoxin [Caldilineaceae bacterium]
MHNIQPIRPIPPVRPISSLRQDQDSILDAMDKEPVILSQRGRERAVLVSVEQWNHMVALLEMYQGVWRADLAKLQTENEYIEANTLKEAMAIYRKQP